MAGCLFLYKCTQREKEAEYKIGEYLYKDGYHNIHTDINCSMLLDVSPTRILYADFDPANESFCRKCVPDYIYEQMLEDCKFNHVYDTFRARFSKQIYEFMFSSYTSCRNYIEKGDLWALHRLYSINAVSTNRGEFDSFEEFLTYYGRADLVKEIPLLYPNIQPSDKRLYLLMYQNLINHIRAYYDRESEDEFIQHAQESPERREWMYSVCKEYMKVGSYEEFEKTILF